MTRRTRLKQMPPAMMSSIRAEVKMMLHAQRDELRNRWSADTTKNRSPIDVSFDCRSGYYGEAFGILRALKVLGYGYFGSSNLPASRERHSQAYNVKQPEQNLRWWMCQIEREVLEEEGFDTDHHCAYCMEKYHKDDQSLLQKMREKANAG